MTVQWRMEIANALVEPGNHAIRRFPIEVVLLRKGIHFIRGRAKSSDPRSIAAFEIQAAIRTEWNAFRCEFVTDRAMFLNGPMGLLRGSGRTCQRTKDGGNENPDAMADDGDKREDTQ